LISRLRIGRQMAMAMIHINRNRENIGQFNEQEVAEGLKSGRFLPTDLAWRDPMPSWEPLSTFTDLPPPEEIAEVKPAERAINSGEELSLGECFSSGWESFRRNMGVLIGATFLLLVVNMSLWFLSELAQAVMKMQMFTGSGDHGQILKIIAMGTGVFASVLTSVITTILSAGFLLMFVKNSRGKAMLADIFSGFSSGRWPQILLGGMACGLIILSVALLTLVPGYFLGVQLQSTIPAVLGLVLFLVPTAYLSVGFGFILPLILDRGIGWQEAMRTAISTVHRQWFSTAGLILISSLVTLSGIFACCVGILFTMPLGYAILAEGYRRLFGDPPESSQD